MLIPADFGEIHVPMLMIATLIGYQLAIYFFYQYFKGKNENLELNKILLAFGFFFAFLMSAFLVRTINNYRIQNQILTIILGRTTVIVVILAVVSFLAVTSKDKFKELIDPKIAKALIITNFIPLILVFFFEPDSIIIQTTLIFNTLGLVYMFILQLKLTRRATGEIKSRLKSILSGEVLLGIGIAFGGEDTPAIIISKNVQNILAIIVAIIGLMIVFLGTYHFPAFLEFEWKNNLQKLYVIDQDAFMKLYSYDFKERKDESADILEDVIQEKREKDHAFSRGLLGIEEIINTCTASKEKKINAITHGELILLINNGEQDFSFLSYVLVVNKELKSLKYFLKEIQMQFQSFFKDILLNIDDLRGNEERIFSGFDILLENMIK